MPSSFSSLPACLIWPALHITPTPKLATPTPAESWLTTRRQGDIPGTYRAPKKPKNLGDPERNDYSTSSHACLHSLVLPFLWSLELPSPRAEAEVLALGECCWGGIEALAVIAELFPPGVASLGEWGLSQILVATYINGNTCVICEE